MRLRPSGIIYLVSISRWLLCVLLLLTACKKSESFEESDIRTLVIGHGGLGFYEFAHHPANSWSGVVEAIERYGANGVEVDVQISSDGTLFMYHDQNLEVNSYCTGCFHDWPAAALEQCLFKSELKANDRICRVERLLERYADAPKKPLVFLDLKNPTSCLGNDPATRTSYFQTIFDEAARLIQKYRASDWVFLQSDSSKWLSYVRQRYPDVRVLYDYVQTADDIRHAARAGYYGVASSGSSLSADEVALAHEEGLKVQLYGALLQQDIAQELRKMPDYFLTDNIPLTLRVLNTLTD